MTIIVILFKVNKDLKVLYLIILLLNLIVHLWIENNKDLLLNIKEIT